MSLCAWLKIRELVDRDFVDRDFVDRKFVAYIRMDIYEGLTQA